MKVPIWTQMANLTHSTAATLKDETPSTRSHRRPYTPKRDGDPLTADDAKT